jgi:hypothetical protein
VGDVSAVIRVALTGRAVSPDLYEIQRILGDELVRARLENGLKSSPGSGPEDSRENGPESGPEGGTKKFY